MRLDPLLDLPENPAQKTDDDSPFDEEYMINLIETYWNGLPESAREAIRRVIEAFIPKAEGVKE